MENIIRFTQADLTRYTSQRSGEIKFGERILTLTNDATVFEDIAASEAEFVLFGIPEDIGVRANYGRQGTSLAWETTLKNIVNLQHNKFCKGGRLLILGQLNVTDAMHQAALADAATKEGRKQLSGLIEKIDKDVSHIVCQIVKAGKTPIIIGGGHNNAYGNIKGTALAKGKPINAINFDALTDFMMLDGRHSGNGFSYAFEEGFLKNYFVFGLHENYASKGIMESVKKHTDRIKFNTYEQIAIRKEKSFSEEKEKALEFIREDFFGVEIDLNAVLNTASSAMTPSGFSVEKTRQFVHYFGKNHNAAYLHICEGAPNFGDEHNPQLTGKLIACLVTDFIKSKDIKSL